MTVCLIRYLKRNRMSFKLGNIGKKKKKVDSIMYHSINPIINNCLRHALKHLDKYRQRAIDILDLEIDTIRK